jgi:hypothetical protein
MSATIRTLNPATGQLLAEYEAWDAVRIEAAVERAHSAARAWAPAPSWNGPRASATWPASSATTTKPWLIWSSPDGQADR